MKEIGFTKMVASGNDFIVYRLARSPVSLLAEFARRICNRQRGIGADGLLVLSKSNAADIKMRIFNADGSEATMCGNGARCAAFYLGRKLSTIETKAGIIKAKVINDKVKIKLTDPGRIKPGILVKIYNRKLMVNFINTGVPHAVVFVNGLSKIDVAGIGRKIRFHGKFAPYGVNVNFVEEIGRNSIRIRTYERGVEDETLACGTGSVASSLVFALKSGILDLVNVHTQGREILKVYFEREGNRFYNVWLEGKAKIVYKGAYYV